MRSAGGAGGVTGLVGQTLDHFRLLEQIGQGGMATVFRAQDTLTQSVVAVKVLSPTISGDRKFVKRFRREAEIARKLQHPNILPVIHYGQARGSVYLVMPFVPGRTLQDHLSRRALTPAESARWIAQVCEALDFAHRKGVIHRDVKPSNIMIDQQGNARLMDFGLARMVEGTSTLTGSMLMGTPAYVSPEQGRGLPVDARTDQYALGVILFQIAVGRLPFDADTPMGTVLMHIQDSIPRPRQLNPEISPALEAVILKSLSKDRTKRFPSAAALNRAYQSALAGVVPPGVEIAGVVPQGSTQALGAARAAVGPLASSPRRRLGPGFWLGLGVPVLVVLVGVLALPSILDALGGGPRPAASPTVQSLATLPPVEPLPTATVAPATPTATPVVSAECPGLRLIGFQRAGSGVEWIIDNGLAAPARLLGLEYQGPIDNYPVALWLGEAAVWEIPVGATPEPGAAITIPQDDRSLLAAGATRRLRLVFPIEDHQPVYSMVLIFDGACSLPTGW